MINKNIKMICNKAFSLVELMVVIAIIGILSAIAVPSYQTYIIKSRMAEAITVLHNLIQTVTIAYESSGVVPTSVYFGGATLTASMSDYSAYTSTYVNSVKFFPYNGNIAYCIQVSGDIGIPGMTASNGTSNGLLTEVCAQVANHNGVNVTSCGQWWLSTGDGGTNGMSVPQKYLPNGCNCTSVNVMGC